MYSGKIVPTKALLKRVFFISAKLKLGGFFVLNFTLGEKHG